ncbi:MAG: GNAT family N-acetyltransferase [Thalassococcus sp.]|uniref:GNAT family N-acetyltransferase n=1 Tax=Thalassococcus sp. TaxID=1928858 RepID=UPI001B2B68A8|nr:GNAT family N-acetyltransferase [Thalassococcus sp.]MBO6868927.1 GNAT family N-acetyltransferase [Thalassococcus sp.]
MTGEPKARLIDPLKVHVPHQVETPRLRLKRASVQLATALAAARSESYASLYPWFHGDMGTEAEEGDPEWQATKLDQQSRDFEQRNSLTYYAFKEDHLIGMVALQPIWRRGQMKLTYWIRSNAQRHGYATEAVTAMIVFAFDTLDARLVTTGHAEPNTASARLAQKLGFQQIARQPLACELPDGTLVAGIAYGLETPPHPPKAASR